MTAYYMEPQFREYKQDEWQPGDPIYDYPGDAGTQVVRHLFDLFEDDEHRLWYSLGRSPNTWRCSRCLVAWDNAAGEKCWVCGVEGDLAPWSLIEGILNEAQRRDEGVRRMYAMLVDGPCRGRTFTFPRDELPPIIQIAAPPENLAAMWREDCDPAEPVRFRRFVYQRSASQPEAGPWRSYKFVREE